MQKVYIKSLIFFIVFLLALGAYGYIQYQGKLEGLRDERTKAIEAEREAKERAVDSLKTVFNGEAEKLKNDLEELKNYSDNLIKQIRYYEKRPDLDLDFITASAIVARSKYRPE